MDDCPRVGVSPLTDGGRMTRDGEAGSISGQVFPDKDFRTNISGQVFPDKPAESCTTHEESFISRMIKEGRRASLKGMGPRDSQPMALQLNYS